MWMKVTLVLVGLLVWDATTAEDGQSTLGRVKRLAPVQSFTGYVESGNFTKDIKDFTVTLITGISEAAAANGLIATRKDILLADESVDKPTVASSDKSTEEALAKIDKANDTLTKAAEALEKDRLERQASREKRRAELRIAPEDVAKIAQAVNELYKQEQEAAAASVKAPAPQSSLEPSPAPAPEAVPSVETVEKSAAALGPDILGAIVKASDETGANSGYLLHIALRESGLVLGAKAPTSSATGPFQFIQQTWYQMLGTYGAKHKLDAEVALLVKQRNGSFKPVSEEARVELLTLRTDPYVAALMAGELTMENTASMTKSLGRSPAHGELYAAHVLGASNAVLLVQTRDKSASTSAAKILPSAAAANRWLFYSSDGKARSVAGLFDELSRFMSTREVATVCKANLNYFGT